jgi:DNA-binding response OmpR family regulator
MLRSTSNWKPPEQATPPANDQGPTHCPHCLMRLKDEKSLQIGDFGIDRHMGCALFQGRRLDITGREFNVMALLMEAEGRVVTKEHLWMNYQGPNSVGHVDTEIKIIDVFICKLRKKLKEQTGREPVGTVWGRGYFWQVTN